MEPSWYICSEGAVWYDLEMYDEKTGTLGNKG